MIQRRVRASKLESGCKTGAQSWEATSVMSAAAAIIVFGLFVAARNQNSNVIVKKEAPLLKEVSLDLNHPPDEIRDLIHGHQAYTRCVYTLAWSAADELISKNSEGSNVSATVSISDLTVTLTLVTTYYIPSATSKVVRDHESGHKRIGELMYESADIEARRLAEPMIGQTFSGKGADVDAARRDAVDVAGKQLLAKYLGSVVKEGQRIQDTYDEITRKGSNQDIAVSDAVRLAFDRCKHPLGSKQ
jgi:hypothetical protein